MKRIKRQRRRRRWIIAGVTTAVSIGLIATLIIFAPKLQRRSTKQTESIPQTSNTAQTTEAQEQLNQRIKQAAINSKISEIEQLLQEYDSNLSVGFYDFATGYTYTYNADTVYYAASLVKVVAAMYAYENMDLTDNVRDLVHRAISVSDNSAYQSLVQMIGPKNLKAYGESIGLEDFLQTADLYYSDTTVTDQLTTFKNLWQLVNTHEQGEELKNDFIGSNSCYLTAAEGVDIICKYGQYNQNFHNAGIVLTEQPYIVVILTEANGNNHAEIIREISQKLYELNQLL